MLFYFGSENESVIAERSGASKVLGLGASGRVIENLKKVGKLIFSSDFI